MTMPMFPTMFMLRLPQMSMASPPRRQPTGLAIAYTLAETHTGTLDRSDVIDIETAVFWEVMRCSLVVRGTV
jgi:hypothetical protein